MNIYADTSFFVSLYIPDSHTVEVERRLRSSRAIWMTPLHVAEWTHAIELHVFRQNISRSEADRASRRFHEHRTQGFWVQAALPEHAFEICADLAKQHASRLGIRTLDTLHVAAAMELASERFWTFDQRQEKLAVTVGLKTV